jgi:phosphoserine phosphatase RsbU/P
MSDPAPRTPPPTAIEGGLQAEVDRLRRALGVKSFQLESLFELSRELAQSLDESLVQDLLLPTLMGHLTVSRCALFVGEADGMRLAASRGLRHASGVTLEARDWLGIEVPTSIGALAHGPLRSQLEDLRLALVVPAEVGVTRGWLALGPRPAGLEFGSGECELALTLSRQALTVIETVRLHHLRLEKLRQDRELALAREIQETLLPRASLAPGPFEVAAASRPCQAVGGDYYDFIPLAGGRLGLVVADVSGKGTPASLLMASVHAAVHVLCDTLDPVALLTRINRMLCDSTQAHRYVTLFYAVCDPHAGELQFVNAGHVPPLHMTSDGTLTQLTEGGPAAGLIEDATYTMGRCPLVAGDALVLVTDGVTEAFSLDEEEYGAARLRACLQGAKGSSAASMLNRLVSDVLAWAGPPGCSDDLTAVVLRRQ